MPSPGARKVGSIGDRAMQEALIGSRWIWPRATISGSLYMNMNFNMSVNMNTIMNSKPNIMNKNLNRALDIDPISQQTAAHRAYDNAQADMTSRIQSHYASTQTENKKEMFLICW
jgi:hypothetical protein